VSFQGKYQILSALSDGESQSFRAKQISSGRPVFVHHLATGRTPPDQPDLASLIFKFLRSASAEESRNLLDMGEDEGRIFVVTADLPACLDLRHWLQSVTEAHAGEGDDAQRAAHGTLDSGNLDFTRTFTTEALRQVARFLVSASVRTSPEPSAVPPVVPTPDKSPRVIIPPPEVPAASSEFADRTPRNFAGLWEMASPSNLSGDPASLPTPPPSLNGSKAPVEIPEVMAESLSPRSPLNIHDAPTEAVMSLQAQALGRERAPAAGAGPAEAKGETGPSAGSVQAPRDVINPPVAQREAEISKSSPPPAVTPAASGPETIAPSALEELLLGSRKAPSQDSVPASTPNADDKQEADVKSAEEVPRRQIPMGFEVVFQSSKPRSRPTASGVADQSGIMAAPGPLAPRTGPEESAPAPSLPRVPQPLVSPPTDKIENRPAFDFLIALGEQRQVAGTRKEPTALPLTPPAQQSPRGSEVATRLVSAPPTSPTRPAPQAPPSGPASAGWAAKPVSAPMPTPPNRAQPGEYTRMIENVKGLAGPLPPVGSPEVPPVGYRPAATSNVPPPVPLQASFLRVPAPQSPPYYEAFPQSQPSPSVANDAPAHSTGKKRKVWVPILILSSLFLMTVALVLFFALKH
jgi:hypothetical protein